MHAAAGAPQRFEDRCRRADRCQPAGLARATRARAPPAQRAASRTAAFDVLLEALAHNPHGLTVHRGDLGRRCCSWACRAITSSATSSAARDAVFFLDPHVCMKCQYRSTELLWQCPHCHEWNTFVEERIAPAKKASRRRASSRTQLRSLAVRAVSLPSDRALVTYERAERSVCRSRA